MKKYLNYVITTLFMLCLTIMPVQITADSGFDAGYDSGGGSSSHDHSSSGSGSGSPIFTFFCFTIMACILYTGFSDNIVKRFKNKIIKGILIFIYWYFFVKMIESSLDFESKISSILAIILGITGEICVNKFAEKQRKKTEEQYFGKKSISTSNIDEADFNNKIFNIYKDVQIAWMNMDLESVRTVLTDEMYNMYKMQLQTLERKHQRNIMEDIEFVNAKIMDFKEIDGKEEIDVVLEVTCKDYIINEKTKLVARGNKNTINDYVYTLTFIRNKKVNFQKCPNCGANFENASSKCEYCGSIVIHESDEYVLSKKQMLHQSIK